MFASGDTRKYLVNRLALQKDANKRTVNPPTLTGQSNAFTVLGSVATDFRADAVEADLDMIAGPDGSTIPSREPGLAVAGRGYCNQAPFCVFWTRPDYDENHQPTTDTKYTYAIAVPGEPPKPKSDVAIVAGSFRGQEQSLVVAWVNTLNEVMVAHIVAARSTIRNRFVVERLALVGGDPVKIGDATPGTNPSLAVGDILGSGSDQFAVAWASPASGAFPEVSVQLMSIGDGGTPEIAKPVTTIIPVTGGSQIVQTTPSIVALKDNSLGSGTTQTRFIVAPGVLPSRSLVEVSVDDQGDFVQQTIQAKTTGLFPYSMETVDDVTGDGIDEIAIHAFGSFANNSPWELAVLTLGEVVNGSPVYRVLDTEDAAPEMEIAVLDARPTTHQSIAPVPGKRNPAAFQQIAASAIQTCVGGTGFKVVYAFLSLSGDGKFTVSGPADMDSTCTASRNTLPKMTSFALDGRAELGDPVRGSYTTLEPAVILNAPPTHFDVLDGKMYDPNFCYAGNQYLVPAVCFFTSAYELEETASTEVTSEATEDWAISTKAEAEFSLFSIVDVGVEVTGGYGENFKEINATKTTDKVEVKVKALNTDKVYAIRRAYDTLEYPLYQPGRSDASEYLLATTPHTVSKRWLDINSPDAVDLNVNHQPGNILSYPEDVTPGENPFISGDGDTFADLQEFEISDSSSYDYTLTRERMQNSSAATTKEWNVGGTLKGSGKVAGLVKVSVEVSGNYKNSQLTNTSTSVGNTTKLSASLAGIDESFGETAYTVKPFAYWDESAALVLDYAVSPSVAPPGAPKTWWQQKYGSRPDLTLKLPRLLDSEKQAGISSDSARFISPGVQIFRGPCDPKDPLAMSPEYPKPGVNLCLRAEVENYSLKDQTGTTSVEFYDADPDVGGVLLGSVDDVKPVPARDSQYVYFDWTPDARYAGSMPRIFAKVDATDTVTEIHETNNKGYRMYRAMADLQVAPRAPEEVLAEPQPGRDLMVTWSDPQELVQPPGHTWRVVAYPDGGGQSLEQSVAGDQLSALFSDIAPGRYRVAVFSVHNGVTSPASHPSEPQDVGIEAPDAASGLQAVAGDQQVTLNWSPPASTGGAAVDTYRIAEYRDPGENFPEPPVDATVSGSTTGLTVKGLTNGRPYRFIVTAVNSAGTGPDSSPSDPVTPRGVPTRPTNVKANLGGPGEAVISWEKPLVSPDRSEVTAFEIVASPGGRLTSAGAGETSVTMDGLKVGTAYTFSVRANSGSGWGAPSEPSNSLTLPGIPSEPRNVTGNAGLTPGSARVTWVAPRDSGGVPIAEYEVCVEGGQCQNLGGGRDEASFTGLQTGIPLTFVVTARNASGFQSAAARSDQLTLEERPRIALMSGPGQGSFTGPDVVLEFALARPGEVTCYIDGMGRQCAPPVRLTGLSNGPHSFRAEVTTAGGKSSTDLIAWTVDGAAPTSRIDDLPAIARQGVPRLAYSGSDRGGSGLASYQIRTRAIGLLGRFPKPVTQSINTSETEMEQRLGVERGYTVCVSVRSLDQIGNASEWTAWRCSTRPLDQAGLQLSDGWRTTKGRFFSAGQAAQTSLRGQTAAVRVGRSHRVWVQAVACRECGSIEVRHRGQVIDTLDLSAVETGSPTSAAKARVKEFAIEWPEAARGTLRLRSLGGPVTLDGVLLVRDR